MPATRFHSPPQEFCAEDDGCDLPSPPGNCPPSAVADQIIPWPEVQEGELLLWDGEFRLITRLIDYAGVPLMWFDGSKTGGGVLPCGTYAAVRRYTED